MKGHQTKTQTDNLLKTTDPAFVAAVTNETYPGFFHPDTFRKNRDSFLMSLLAAATFTFAGYMAVMHHAADHHHNPTPPLIVIEEPSPEQVEEPAKEQPKQHAEDALRESAWILIDT